MSENEKGPLAEVLRDLRLDLKLCSGEQSWKAFLFYLFHPGFQVCFLYRWAHYFFGKGWILPARMVTVFSRLVTGCDIHYGAIIEGGVLFPHGRGVVIGDGVVISKNCSIFHSVTLGDSETREGAPFLEEGVNLYPGTVVAGPVRIGEYCRVGPNVYLTESVDSHTRVSPPKPLSKKVL